MAKSTSITLDDHSEEFIAKQVKTGRYRSPSDVVRESLRLFEERERKLDLLRQALKEGEESGDATPLDINEVIREAKQEAGLDV